MCKSKLIIMLDSEGELNCNIDHSINEFDGNYNFCGGKNCVFSKEIDGNGGAWYLNEAIQGCDYVNRYFYFFFYLCCLQKYYIIILNNF